MNWYSVDVWDTPQTLWWKFRNEEGKFRSGWGWEESDGMWSGDDGMTYPVYRSSPYRIDELRNCKELHRGEWSQLKERYKKQKESLYYDRYLWRPPKWIEVKRKWKKRPPPVTSTSYRVSRIDMEKAFEAFCDEHNVTPDERSALRRRVEQEGFLG